MSEVISIHTSLLNDEMKIEKRKNDRLAIVYGIIAQLIWAFNAIQLKSYKPWFPDAFSNNSLVFWRSVPIWVLGYVFSRRSNIEIIPLSKIKHLYWFLIRSAGNYVSVILWVTMLKFFRVSTCQCIAGCHPVLVIFLSVIIIKERFYYRYIIGVILSIIGTAIIVLNENQPKETKEIEIKDNDLSYNDNGSLIVAILVCLTHLMVISFTSFGQKVLCNEHISPEVQNYYLGMYNSLPALFISVLELHLGLSNLIYVIYGLSNGFVFYVANYYTALALNYMPISKFIPMTYLCTVFIFILGSVLLHEPVFFTDILGSLIILSFQVYNVWVPLKK